MTDRIMTWLMDFLYMLPCVLIALSVHECAHGYAAHKLGDSTARNLGRLTLNPIKHIDPIGFIAMFIFKFGWAKPVPVNGRNLKKPKRDMALVSLAGPVSNILLGFIGVLIMKIFLTAFNGRLESDPSIVYNYFIGSPDFLTRFLEQAVTFFSYFAILNIGLAIFNLIPLPPLDGSKILYSFLPSKAAFWLATHEQYLSIALIAIMLFDINIPFISQAVSAIYLGFYNLLSFIF